MDEIGAGAHLGATGAAGCSNRATPRGRAQVRSCGVLAFAVLLAGCTVGPAHRVPDVALPPAFDQAPVAAAKTTPSVLWSAFAEPELDALIARALDANTTVRQAAARLAETRAFRGLTPYAYFPTVTAAADAERSRTSTDDPFAFEDTDVTETYRAGFDASWEIDLFGSLRNQSRAISRRYEADAAALANVRLSIVAETAQAYFALRGAHRRLAIAQRNLESLGERVRIVRAQYDNGRANGLDLARAEAQRDALAAQLPDAEAEIVRQEQRLAVLTAQPVADVRMQVDADKLPAALPELTAVGTPQQWLQRRPDVREAERRLAAATADIGVEIAEFYPKLTLLGDFGWTAQSAGGIGETGAERWRWGPSLTWSFLNFGRVRQQVKAADARADAAAALYHETVLKALEETENAFAGWRAANRSAAALADAVRAAREAARIAQVRFDNGADDFLPVIDAERTRLDLEDQEVQAQTARATALAALYKALAGDFAQAAPETDSAAEEGGP